MKFISNLCLQTACIIGCSCATDFRKTLADNGPVSPVYTNTLGALQKVHNNYATMYLLKTDQIFVIPTKFIQVIHNDEKCRIIYQ